jgi:nucleoside 2-deoxyribosyltransferase
MKIVFLAGPYRGKGEQGEIERNITQSARFQAILARAGIVAYSPNVHDAHWETLNGGSVVAARTLKEFSEMVLEKLAEALAVMPKWEDSRGTLVEIALAKERGIPIFYLKDENDLGGLKEWYDK